jgi:hypothetical protein
VEETFDLVLYLINRAICSLGVEILRPVLEVQREDVHNITNHSQDTLCVVIYGWFVVEIRFHVCDKLPL